jgi:hypothetical protein
MTFTFHILSANALSKIYLTIFLLLGHLRWSIVPTNSGQCNNGSFYFLRHLSDVGALGVTPLPTRSGLWNFIRGLLDEATVDKIRFLSSQKDFEVLQQFISLPNLPTKYGGESTYPYDAADVVNASAQDPKWGVWYNMASPPLAKTGSDTVSETPSA